MEACQDADNFRSKKVFGAIDEIELVHSALLLCCKDSVFLPHFTIICIKFAKMMQKKHLMRQIRHVTSFSCKQINAYLCC